MKRILSILCCLALVFCLTACGKEPELEEPSTGSIPVNSNTLTSTKPQKPYWDTHEPLSYAGIYDGQRFSGDYEIANIEKTKVGDVYFTLPKLVGKVEDNSQPSSTKKQTISEPFSVDVYYDKKNNRYIDAWQTGSHTDEDGYAEFDFKTREYYYNDTSCKVPQAKDTFIEADDKFVVYVYGPKEAEPKAKSQTRIYWKKDAGLLGVYSYYSDSYYGTSVTNIRFTSKTARGWNMAETIVPNALPGAKRVWPEKLWPAEYKGLTAPELRAILEEY